MQRADHRDLQAGSLLQHCLYLHAILAHNVAVIAAQLAVQAMGVQILVVEYSAVQGSEAAESVCREQDLVGGLIGHHSLRPVHHGSHDKGELVLAQIQYIAFLDHNGTAFQIHIVELVHQAEGLLVAHDPHRGIEPCQLRNVSAVVGLHVVDYQIVRLTAAQSSSQILQILPGHRGISSVHDGCLLVQDHIGIVSHAIRNGEHILKQVQTAVAGANPEDLVCDVADILHSIVTFHKFIIASA